MYFSYWLLFTRIQRYYEKANSQFSYCRCRTGSSLQLSVVQEVFSTTNDIYRFFSDVSPNMSLH